MSDFTATFDVVDGWVLYELDPAQVDAMSAARVDVLLETAPKLRKSRGRLIDLVVQSSISAGVSGASSGAIRCDTTGRRRPIYASVLLNLIERDPDRPVADDLDEIKTFTMTNSESNERPPVIQRTELDGRPALRVDALRRAELDPLERSAPRGLLWRVIEYWVPVAGEIGIIKLNFDTPSDGPTDKLMVEFEAIAASLSITTT